MLYRSGGDRKAPVPPGVLFNKIIGESIAENRSSSRGPRASDSRFVGPPRAGGFVEARPSRPSKRRETRELVDVLDQLKIAIAAGNTDAARRVLAGLDRTPEIDISPKSPALVGPDASSERAPVHRRRSERAVADRPSPFVSNITLLWMAAALIFGFADTFTSVMVFTRGGYESNPLMVVVLSWLGNSIWAFVFVKTIAFFVLVMVSYNTNHIMKWVIPLVVSVVGLALVFNNLQNL